MLNNKCAKCNETVKTVPTSIGELCLGCWIDWQGDEPDFCSTCEKAELCEHFEMTECYNTERCDYLDKQRSKDV